MDVNFDLDDQDDDQDDDDGDQDDDADEGGGKRRRKKCELETPIVELQLSAVFIGSTREAME